MLAFVFYGYVFACLLMLGAAAVEWFLGVEAGQRSLEEIASPLSSSSSSSPSSSD